MSRLRGATSRVAVAAVTLLVTLLVTVLAACSIQPNSAPRDVPEEQRAPLDVSGGDAGPAEGTGRIFLLRSVDEDGEGDADAKPKLVSVLRPALAPEPVFTALLQGPNEDELNDGLTTALPVGLELRSVRQSAGTLIVDVTEEMLDLTSEDLRLAVAQIVYTADELATVRNVELLVEGEQREWPNGRGELQLDPLTVYDFPGVAESAQPPLPPVPAPQAS